MTMDQMRTGNVFDLNNAREPITIVGCGALGSAVALQLAKLGCTLRLIDGDKVEGHNIPNQLIYGVSDIGKFKAEALRDRLIELTDNREHAARVKFVDQDTVLNDRFVFCCVDSMAARKLIFDRITDRDGVYFDGRIGAYDYSSYAVSRSYIDQMLEYTNTLHDDDDTVADRAACGTILSIGSTAMLCASHIVWQFLKAVKGDKSPNVIVGSVRDHHFFTKSFMWDGEEDGGVHVDVDTKYESRR